jgi:hypothetical protein
MLRRQEKGVRIDFLDDAAEVHHRHPVGHMLHDGEIVADQEIGEAEFPVNNAVVRRCAAPGLIDTERKASSTTGDPLHHATHTTLLGRRGLPSEVAATVRWLAGPSGRFVTGQVIHVNGGAYLGS